MKVTSIVMNDDQVFVTFHEPYPDGSIHPTSLIIHRTHWEALKEHLTAEPIKSGDEEVSFEIEESD